MGVFFFCVSCDFINEAAGWRESWDVPQSWLNALWFTYICLSSIEGTDDITRGTQPFGSPPQRFLYSLAIVPHSPSETHSSFDFHPYYLSPRVSPSTIFAYILQSAGSFPSTLLLACCCWCSAGFRECLGFHFVIGSCYCRTGGKSHNKSSFMWTTSHTVDHSDAVIIYFLKKKNNPASHCYSLQDRPELNWPNEGGAAILAASQQPLEVYNADEYNDEHTAAMRTMEIKLHGFFCSVKCVQCWIYWCQRGEGRLYTWTILNNGNRS